MDPTQSAPTDPGPEVSTNHPPLLPPPSLIEEGSTAPPDDCRGSTPGLFTPDRSRIGHQAFASSSSSSSSSSSDISHHHTVLDAIGSFPPQNHQLNVPPIHVQKQSSPSRHHLRSASSGPRPKPPSILRVRSTPTIPTMQDYHQYMPRSNSPPGGRNYRAASPARRVHNDAFSTTQLGNALSDISEDGATRPTSQPEFLRHSHTPPPSAYHSLTNRTRPASPFRRDQARPRTPNSSPYMDSLRYNESYPGSASSLSSMPSTPTSQRSRSPSISSLETIPDSPHAEERAMEEDIIARLKIQADAADAAANLAAANSPIAQEIRRRSSIDVTATGYSGRDKRKRWSVCGAERSALDLETIYEDGS